MANFDRRWKCLTHAFQMFDKRLSFCERFVFGEVQKNVNIVELENAAKRAFDYKKTRLRYSRDRALQRHMLILSFPQDCGIQIYVYLRHNVPYLI